MAKGEKQRAVTNENFIIGSTLPRRNLSRTGAKEAFLGPLLRAGAGTELATGAKMASEASAATGLPPCYGRIGVISRATVSYPARSSFPSGGTFPTVKKSSKEGKRQAKYVVKQVYVCHYKNALHVRGRLSPFLILLFILLVWAGEKENIVQKKMSTPPPQQRP